MKNKAVTIILLVLLFLTSSYAECVAMYRNHLRVTKGPDRVDETPALAEIELSGIYQRGLHPRLHLSKSSSIPSMPLRGKGIWNIKSGSHIKVQGVMCSYYYDSSKDDHPFPSQWLVWLDVTEVKVLTEAPGEKKIISMNKGKQATITEVGKTRTIESILSSLKSELVQWSSSFPELLEAKSCAIKDHYIRYQHNCRYMGKKGFQDEQSNGVAVFFRVMTTQDFYEMGGQKRFPDYEWPNLGMVGWMSLHVGKNSSPGLRNLLNSTIINHIVMIDEMERGFY